MKRFLSAILVFVLTFGTAAVWGKPPYRERPAVWGKPPYRERPAVWGKPPYPRNAQSKGPVQTEFRRAPYVGAIAADAGGRILFTDNAEKKAYPASVTKLMTLLIVLEDIAAGKYSFDDAVTATADVYRSEPSWIGLKVGDKIVIRDLIISLMVESANDAAIALGVNSSGSFDGFIVKMNARAKELGMTATEYYNPNGLPPNAAKKYPWKKFNYTTAADQLKLAQELAKHPETFDFTSVKTADLVKTPSGYRVNVTRKVGVPNTTTSLAEGETLVKQLRNHNNIMVKDKKKLINPDGSEAVDGFKTGYIDAGGSSIVITAKRGPKRVIAVVLGSASSDDRDEAARRIVSDALEAVAW